MFRDCTKSNRVEDFPTSYDVSKGDLVHSFFRPQFGKLWFLFTQLPKLVITTKLLCQGLEIQHQASSQSNTEDIEVNPDNKVCTEGL